MSESSATPLSPRETAAQALSPAVLQAALLEKDGPDAKFISFEVKDFCEKGVNFACYVTSVVVKYTSGGEEKCASFVAKLNQLGGIADAGKFVAKIFEKEGKFLSELLPAMNKIRKNISLPSLKYPTCFYASFEEGREILLLEDMREKSFQLIKTNVGLDADHVLLVMEELGQVHASSCLLEEEMGTEKFLATFNFFDEIFSGDAMAPTFKKSFSGYVANGIRAAKQLGGREELLERLNKMAPECHQVLTESLKPCDPKFRVVNHGDCMLYNMLFRYEEGKVEDICLLDLQINRHASLALDLNHFLFTSVDSETRKTGLMNFLSTYYASFKKVFDSAKKPMKFTLDELYDEYRSRNTYGALLCFMSLTFFGLKTEDKPDLSELKDENMAGEMDDSLVKLRVALDTNPILRARLQGLIEEIEEHCIF